MAVYLLATLDTKGAEAGFVRDALVALGVDVLLVDTGVLGPPSVAPDLSRDVVLATTGSSSAALAAAGDRGRGVAQMSEAAARLVREHHSVGKVSGLISIGGSAGTAIGTAAMRALPLGVPKLMVSTLASGQVRHYVGDKDILMLNSVVDVAGLNRVSRPILLNAAAAMAGMVSAHRPAANAALDKPLVAATMFGVTTPCIEEARKLLNAAGYEVLVFHATGGGGQAMESLISDGLISGVLDITTTELADELVGGVLSAGPDRLTAAARKGVPQVVSVGALDMINFHARDTVPQRFGDRMFYQHNPSVTLMRTTVEENVKLGAELGRKVAASKGPSAIVLPQGGVSAIDRTGQPFDDPMAREALFRAIREHAADVPVIESQHHINDPPFAQLAAGKLIELMRTSAAKQSTTSGDATTS